MCLTIESLYNIEFHFLFFSLLFDFKSTDSVEIDFHASIITYQLYIDKSMIIQIGS